ncbi:MAG: hypothetical protein IPK71_00270 [Myxococcales bacterium]|nr:hypothetical protein [Myxococcales bacterium]
MALSRPRRMGSKKKKRREGPEEARARREGEPRPAKKREADPPKSSTRSEPEAARETSAGPKPLPKPLPQPSFPEDASVIDNPLALAVLFAAVLGVLILLTWKLGGTRASDEGPESALPKESFLVAKIDVPELRASPLYTAVVGQEGTTATLGLDELSRGCGFDPLTRVDDMWVTLPEGEQRGTFGLAAHVRVTESELATCAERIALARSQKTAPKVVGSFHVLEASGAGAFAAGIGFREGGLLVVAAGEWLTAMLKAAEGQHPRALVGDAHGEMLASLRAEDGMKKPTAIVSVVLPSAVRERLRAEMSREVSGASGEDSPENVMAAVLSVGVAGAALVARAGEELAVRAELRADTPAHAAVLARLVERKRFALSKEIGLRLFGFGPILDSLSVSTDGARVRISAHAPIDDLSRGIASALDYGRRKGAEEAPKLPARAPDEVVPSKRDGGPAR